MMNAASIVVMAWALGAQESDVTERFAAAEFRHVAAPRYAERGLPYRMLAPLEVAEGERYPLVVFLHGAGERGDDNVAQLKYLPTWLSAPKARAKHPCFLIAPQCPKNQKWSSAHWAEKQPRMAEQPVDEMATVIALIEHVMATQPIDPDRVYLTGLSMGGFGTWELAMRRPAMFAAVAPICGGGDATQAAKLKDVPVWAWHGDKDRAVPVTRTRELIEALRAAGGEPRYTELRGVGHDSWTAAYTREDGVVPWMFAQRRGD